MSFGKRDPKQFLDPANNRRASPRRRQYKAAKLVFNDNQSVVDCVVRDISDTGARVRVGGWFDCPERLVMKVSDGVSYSAEVVWFQNHELGLRFHGKANLEMVEKLTSVQGVLDQARALTADGLLRSLATHHHFADDGVKSAADGLAAAHERMIETLRAVLHSEEKKYREEE